MSDCTEIQMLLSAMLDGELGEAERARVQAHLAECTDCAAMAEAFSAVSAALAPEEVPEGLHESIMARVALGQKVQRQQKRLRVLRPTLAAAACMVVILGSVLMANHGLRMGSADSASGGTAPMAPESMNTSTTAARSAETAADAAAPVPEPETAPAEASFDAEAPEYRLNLSSAAAPETNGAALETEDAGPVLTAELEILSWENETCRAAILSLPDGGSALAVGDEVALRAGEWIELRFDAQGVSALDTRLPVAHWIPLSAGAHVRIAFHVEDALPDGTPVLCMEEFE